MKKFTICLIACLAFVQSTYAATSALVNSLIEYTAIIDAIGSPSFEVIPSTEFIVTIKRTTKQVDVFGKVKYKIVTRNVPAADVSVCAEQETSGDLASASNKCKGKSHKTHTYTATLRVSPNPAIGPNIVAVEKIKKVSSHTHVFLASDESDPEDSESFD